MLNEVGIDLWQAGDLAGAQLRFAEALARAPGYAAACSNLGMVLAEQRRLDEGLKHLLRAVEIDPRHAGARINLANALHLDGQIDAAVAHYLEALRLAPDAPETRVNVVKPLMDACQWTEVESIVAELIELYASAPEAHWAERVSPFVSQLLPLPPDFRRRLAVYHARELSLRWAPQRARVAQARAPRDHQRIRVGYLSGDFRNHALAHLTAGMFAHHDRRRFRITAYSFGSDDGSEQRRRIVSGVDRFVDIAGESYAASAARIAGDGIDILVDLAGYSGASRSEILAMRPAPVQVSWLGFPGTMGADFIDYFVADKVALPERLAGQFTEAIAWLPDCYQVNDAEQAIAADITTREQAGLPASGFVFCCFNQAYKIDRGIFGSWMRMLQAVPGSVLWLMTSSGLAQGNLRRAAAAAGIDPQRLVFAQGLPKEAHLARQRLAGLFLDTAVVTAGTTASDALWAGVPVLTCPGETLGARVAASVVSAIGLPDLAACNRAEYERMGVELARNPGMLGDIRERLAANRVGAPLFDTPRFVSGFERALESMQAAALAGRPPEAFSV